MFLQDFRNIVAELCEADPTGEFRDKASWKSKMEWGPPSADAGTESGGSPMLGWQSDLPVTGIRLRLKSFWRRNAVATIPLLGGFRQPTGEVIVLVRSGKKNVRATDTEWKIGPRSTICVDGFNEQRLRIPDDWDTFGKLKPGDEFRLAGQVWRKLSSSELREVVGTRVWSVYQG